MRDDSDDADMAQTIIETGDQRHCAQLLVRHWPTAAKDRILAVIEWAEPELRRMGFSDLSLLRTELARIHPAWGSSAA